LRNKTDISQPLKLKIADLIIEARCADPDIRLTTSPICREFLVNTGQPDCILDVHYGKAPDMTLGNQLFETGDGPWSLYSYGEKYVFQMLGGSSSQKFVHRTAIFEPAFDKGELFVYPRSGLPVADPISPEKEKNSLDPFLTPLDEWLVVNLLAQGKGLHIHALGIVHEGRGLVFCGVSGAGKSTLAELWKKLPVKILSDDRISLREREGAMWAYGTPWHGDARVSLPEKAPLKALYFIVHGPENRIVPLPTAEVTTRLLVRSFPTFYLKRGMEYTLTFISDLTRNVPCYELQFTPDRRAVDEVLKHVESLPH
jgi:hypothetical protein